MICGPLFCRSTELAVAGGGCHNYVTCLGRNQNTALHIEDNHPNKERSFTILHAQTPGQFLFEFVLT